MSAQPPNYSTVCKSPAFPSVTNSGTEKMLKFHNSAAGGGVVREEMTNIMLMAHIANSRNAVSNLPCCIMAIVNPAVNPAAKILMSPRFMISFLKSLGV